MNYKKAFTRFKLFGAFCDDRNDACDHNCDKCNAMESAIIEALEKQIPKKPRITIHNGYCPNCKNAFGKKYVEDAVIYPHWKGYCPICGQAIDWDEVE